MARSARLLGEREEFVAETRPHWSYLGWPLLSVGASVALAVVVVIVFSGAPVEVAYLLAALVAVTTLWLVGRYMRRASTSLVVTSSRVIRRSGVFSRSNLEIRLERINELSCHQTILGRLIGSGELMIEVGGQSGVVVLEHVPRPTGLQNLISEQVTNWHRGARQFVYETPELSMDTPPAGTRLADGSGAVGGPAERLVQLDELRRRGIVSASEFESKRQQLLREL